MQPVQKVLTTMLWACAVLAMVSVIGANLWRDRAARQLPPEPAEEHLAVLGEAPAFALIDQNEKPVTLQSLRGRPFIANFVFTRCQGPCPVMTAKMSKLQDEVPAAVRLVSFSVDPTQDRPAVLKEYAKAFNTDDGRWHLLTVANPEEAGAVYAVARGMYLTALPANEQNPIIHDERFVLVDADGKIRGYYSSSESDAMARLKSDAAELAASVPPVAPTTATDQATQP